MKTENILNMLKVVVLELNQQTEYDLEIKDKAARILGYQNYEELEVDWYEKENNSFRELKELFDSIKVK